jgi:hypothetical protein
MDIGVFTALKTSKIHKGILSLRLAKILVFELKYLEFMIVNVRTS